MRPATHFLFTGSACRIRSSHRATVPKTGVRIWTLDSGSICINTRERTALLAVRPKFSLLFRIKSIPNCLVFTAYFLIAAHWASTFFVTFRPEAHGGGAEKSGSSMIEVGAFSDCESP
jgi:hypothetical protein